MSLPSFRASALRRREQYPGLLAAWGFDEGTGTTARDSSEHNVPLTLSGSVTWVAGHTGGFALENSATGTALATNWTSLGTPATIMCWAKPLDLTAGTNRPLIGVWNGTDANTSTEFALWAQRGDFSTANVLQGNARIGGGLVTANHTALALNTWVHLALTYDGSTLRLYRDGAEVSNFSITGSITTGTFDFIVVPSGAHAQVDDVRVFNVALSATQVASFMGDPVAP